MGDRYVAGFTIGPCIGPDEFGYQACGYFYEDIDLVAGAVGVRSILDGVDDAATSIPLGTNTLTSMELLIPAQTNSMSVRMA